MALDSRKAKALNWARRKGVKVKFAFGHVWAQVHDSKYRLVPDEVFLK